MLGILSWKPFYSEVWDQKLLADITRMMMLFKIFRIYTLPCAHNAYFMVEYFRYIIHSTSDWLLSFLCVKVCQKRHCQLQPEEEKNNICPCSLQKQVTPDGKVVYRGGPQQQRGPGTSGNPAADYSEGASHVLAVIHEILAHHRAVEQRWSAKKLKLHQRLALRLFQEDVKQVSG